MNYFSSMVSKPKLGEIIWNKAASASPSTAWGSWQSAANPILRDIHEYILVFSKGNYKRERKKDELGKRKNTISKEQFMEWTKSIWTINAESARRIDHPAPFPEELPYRLIQLYSFTNDIILDPFIGSGTTGVAALKSDRFYFGYDTDIEYIKIAELYHFHLITGIFFKSIILNTKKFFTFFEFLIIGIVSAGSIFLK